ncbi:MAG: FAD-dependent oxidoreductase, partial [Patescibacteria group bacterium]
MYDLIIIGGGPGGVAAGIYAARKKIKVALLTETFGGQSLVSADVRNWIGTKSISGFDLAQNLESHLRDQAGIDIIDSERVSKIQKIENGFSIQTESGKDFETKYILTTAGSRRKRLNVPGEDKHEGKGIAYCSICDAPLFGDMVTAVIGGGNAGLEAVV